MITIKSWSRQALTKTKQILGSSEHGVAGVTNKLLTTWQCNDDIDEYQLLQQ